MSTRPSKTGRSATGTARSMTATKSSLRSEPEVIGAAVRQMSTPVKGASRLTSRANTSRATSVTASLPTRASKTTGVTKMCLASTVAPTMTGSSTRSVTPATASRTPRSPVTEFQTYKPRVSSRSTRSATPSRSMTASTSKFTVSKSKSRTGRSKTGAGVKTCAGRTNHWSPVTREQSQLPSRSMTAGTVDVESGRPSEYIVYEEEEREEKSGTSACCCLFWILAGLALVALLVLGGYFLFFKEKGGERDVDTSPTKPREGENDRKDDPVVIDPKPVVIINVPAKKYLQYQWRDDDGTWKNYDAATSWLIQQHNERGRKDFIINAGGDRMFAVALSKTNSRQYNLAWDNNKHQHIVKNGRYVRDSKSRAIRYVKLDKSDNTRLAKLSGFKPTYYWKCDGERRYDTIISSFIEANKFLGNKGCMISLPNDLVFWIDIAGRKQRSYKYKRGQGHTTDGGRYMFNGKVRSIRRLSL